MYCYVRINSYLDCITSFSSIHFFHLGSVICHPLLLLWINLQPNASLGVLLVARMIGFLANVCCFQFIQQFLARCYLVRSCCLTVLIMWLQVVGVTAVKLAVLLAGPPRRLLWFIICQRENESKVQKKVPKILGYLNDQSV